MLFDSVFIFYFRDTDGVLRMYFLVALLLLNKSGVYLGDGRWEEVAEAQTGVVLK